MTGRNDRLDNLARRLDRAANTVPQALEVPDGR